MINRTRFRVILAIGLAAFLTACQRSNQPTTDQSAQSAAQPAANADTGAAASGKSGRSKRRSEGGQKEAASATPAAPAVQTYTVPQGTAISVRLTTPLDSGKTTAGAEFDGTLAQAITVNGVEIAAVGSAVHGKVTNAVSSGRLNRPAELAATLTSLTPAGGQPIEIATNTWSQKGQSHKKRDAELIGGGAGVGALVGAIAGKGKGAAIGAAVGAGAGTAGAAFTGKKEIVLPAETVLNFTLAQPFSVTR